MAKIEYFIGHGDIKIAQLDANYNPLASRAEFTR